MTPVPARRVDDLDDGAGATPGAFEYVVDAEGKACGMFYRCPCGCGCEGYLRFRGTGREERPSWIWDGNREKPTLQPSIHHVLRLTAGGERPHWHGFLRAGVFESC